MKKKIYKKLHSEKGFSLPELLVVLVIIGVLVMIAIPIYNNIATRAKMTEAKIMLNQVHSLQQAYYLEFDYYSDNLQRIGFEQNNLITEGGRARYVIEIEVADHLDYMATATSIVDFNNNGRFNVWKISADGILEQSIAD